MQLELDGVKWKPQGWIRFSKDSSWLSKVWYPKLENNEFHLPIFPELYSFKKKLPPQKKPREKKVMKMTHIFFWCWKKTFQKSQVRCGYKYRLCGLPDQTFASLPRCGSCAATRRVGQRTNRWDPPAFRLLAFRLRNHLLFFHPRWRFR